MTGKENDRIGDPEIFPRHLFFVPKTSDHLYQPGTKGMSDRHTGMLLRNKKDPE